MTTKSKQQLADEKNISVDTVSKTLKAAGIDTSKSEYNEEECDRFYEARRLMDDENYTYKQVSDRFGVGTNNTSANPAAYARQAVRGQLDNLSDLIIDETHQHVSEMIGVALEDLPPIELMIAHEFKNRPQIAENIKAQFRLLSESFKANAESRRERQVYQDNTFDFLPGASDDNDDAWTDGSEADSD